jgi:hypothetical protein
MTTYFASIPANPATSSLFAQIQKQLEFDSAQFGEVTNCAAISEATVLEGVRL